MLWVVRDQSLESCKSTLHFPMNDDAILRKLLHHFLLLTTLGKNFIFQELTFPFQEERIKLNEETQVDTSITEMGRY